MVLESIVRLMSPAAIEQAAKRLNLTDAERLLSGRALSPDSELVAELLKNSAEEIHVQAIRAMHSYDLWPGEHRELALRTDGWPDTVKAVAYLLAYGAILRETADDRLHRVPLLDRRYVPSFPATEPKLGTSWTAGARDRTRRLQKLSRHLRGTNAQEPDAVAVLLQMLESPYLKARLREAKLYEEASSLWIKIFPESRLGARGRLVYSGPIGPGVAELCYKLSRVPERRGAQHAVALHAFECETREFFTRVVGGKLEVNLNEATKKPAKIQAPHRRGWYFETSYYLACCVFPHLDSREGKRAWLGITGKRGKVSAGIDYRREYLRDPLFSRAREETLPWLKKEYPQCSERKTTWRNEPEPWEILARHLKHTNHHQ